ncbi:MAG: hypothetical protein L6R39_004759 [Caloplaca ligustica]|nr:MAG: hypothetical protein L6R39_004759 [Caloplaca ligustica]
MDVSHTRIDELGFKTAIGLFLGIAFSLALGRTYIRIVLTRKVTVDDGFFFLAVITLIAGTTTCYIDIPYLYVQQNVDPSTTVITPQFIELLQRSLRIQAATDVLLSTTLFSVNVPITLLWRVRISLRRKLILGGVLSLSIFTMIVCIVRIAGSDLPNGLVDSIWVNFWLQIEAAVAVMIVSITAYRSLFVNDKFSHRKSPRQYTTNSTLRRRLLWSRRGKGEREGMQLPTLAVPDPALTGVRTVIRRAGNPYEEAASRSEELLVAPPADGRSILVTREHDVEFVSPCSCVET